MESNVLKAVEEISGYTPKEMIAMYDDYERMANECEAYAALGTVEELAALKEAKREMTQQLNDLASRVDGDEAETYTSGYHRGHKIGQVELLQYLLKVDTENRMLPEAPKEE